MTYVEENADTVTLANAGVGAASQLCGLLIEQASAWTSPRCPTTAPAPR